MDKTETRIPDPALSAENKIKWAELKKRLSKYKNAFDFGNYRSVRLHMGDILKQERQFLNALDMYFEVCYLDLNGRANAP